MKSPVTGGAGHVGSHAACLLIKTGHSVEVYNNLVTDLRQIVPDARAIDTELADGARLDGAYAVRHFDAVMHSAAHRRRQ